MYYRLNTSFAFRGWKNLPFAIQALDGPKKDMLPLFFQKKPFLDLLSCNGEEDVDLSSFTAEGRQILDKLLADGIVEQSLTPLPPLKSRQRYRVFPSRYLFSVLWSITGKCNYRCRHCLVSAPGASHPQLPLSDCMHIIGELARSGIQRVDITGGEPLVRSDFEEIVKELTRHEIDINMIFTNGFLLTEDTLRMLARYGQHPLFQLSFDGLGHHDWLRGVNGAEKEADRAFRLLNRHGFAASAVMCIHRENKDCLRDTVNYLAGLGVRSLRLDSPRNLGNWKQYSQKYALSTEELWTVFKKYIDQYFEDGMPIDIDLGSFFQCGKGQTDYRIKYVRDTERGADLNCLRCCENVRYRAFISPEGRLMPCMGFMETALQDKFPSILEHHLGDLALKSYYHDVADTKIRDYLDRNPDCRSCEHLPACLGGCMAEDITEEGDYLVPDQNCCYFHQHIGESSVRAAADLAVGKRQMLAAENSIER